MDGRTEEALFSEETKRNGYTQATLPWIQAKHIQPYETQFVCALLRENGSTGPITLSQSSQELLFWATRLTLARN